MKRISAGIAATFFVIAIGSVKAGIDEAMRG